MLCVLMVSEDIVEQFSLFVPLVTCDVLDDIEVTLISHLVSGGQVDIFTIGRIMNGRNHCKPNKRKKNPTTFFLRAAVCRSLFLISQLTRSGGQGEISKNGSQRLHGLERVENRAENIQTRANPLKPQSSSSSSSKPQDVKHKKHFRFRCC